MMMFRVHILGLASTIAVLWAIAHQSPASSAEGDYTSPIPPEKLSVCPGGVDLRSGRYAYEQQDLSIGNPDADLGISLIRTTENEVKGHKERFGNFAHNWDIFVVAP